MSLEPLDPLVLLPGQQVIIYGERLVTPEKTRNRIVVKNTGVVIPPPPMGKNLIANGRIEDAAGNASLVGWSQSPAWFNSHAPRPDSPSQTHFIQADRDFRPGVVNVWQGGNPSSAYIETCTPGDLPEHAGLALRWEVAHHMVTGDAIWELDGRSDADAPWQASGTVSITEGVPGDKHVKVVNYTNTVNTPGGFRQYRLRAAVTLADNRDGVIFGDVVLAIA